VIRRAGCLVGCMACGPQVVPRSPDRSGQLALCLQTTCGRVTGGQQRRSQGRLWSLRRGRSLGRLLYEAMGRAE
jgi:hypothetical protein